MTDLFLQRLINYYEQLSPTSLAQLADYYHPQAYFKDPFNEVIGVSAISHIFSHMFKLDEQAKFTFSHRFVSPNEPLHAMLMWQMSMTVAKKALTIPGTTHLIFDEDGLVLSHRDYWDTGEELYGKLPWIGGIMRALLAKGSAS